MSKLSLPESVASVSSESFVSSVSSVSSADAPSSVGVPTVAAVSATASTKAAPADKAVAVSQGLASEVFAVRVEYALKELAMTGYEAIDSGFVGELRQLATVAMEIGFTKVSSLLNELVTACENFVRYNENEQAQAITTAIAHLFFALSFLNFGSGGAAKDAAATGASAGANNAGDDESDGEANDADDADDGGMSPEILAALDSDDDFL